MGWKVGKLGNNYYIRPQISFFPLNMNNILEPYVSIL
jgi:hypothetical protein